MVVLLLLAMYGMAAAGVILGYALHSLVHQRPAKSSYNINKEVDKILDALEL